MPQSSDLHGAAPDNSHAALLILDLISDFDFVDGERLYGRALPLGRRIAALKKRARAAGIPTIYVNDNAGRWRSDRADLIAHCLSNRARAHKLVEQIVPEPDDYFILKPKHSGFFATPLHALLDNIGARTLILTGVTSHQCVLFTAADAYVREFDLIIPNDCIAAMETKQTRAALDIFRTALKADTTASNKLRMPRKRKR
jgi:nicotinamidase-related amidase